eukprot:5622014-Prymnesium_polylepis.1
MPPPKAKVLMLHGRNSNKTVAEFQAIILQLDTMADCSTLDAPHVTGQKFDKDMEGEGRSWEGPDGDVRTGLELVVEHCKKHGPFDVAYGFSQGCSVITMLSDAGVLKALGVETPLWKSVVCVCGTGYLITKQTQLPVVEPAAVALPSFHLHGATDNILPESKALLTLFERPHV